MTAPFLCAARLFPSGGGADGANEAPAKESNSVVSRALRDSTSRVFNCLRKSGIDAAVSGLLGASRPPAIVRRVSQFIIYAVNRMLWRGPRAEGCIKFLKTSEIKGNPPAAVMPVCGVTRVFAAAFGAGITNIFRRLAHPVFGFCFGRSAFSFAPAGCCVAVSKVAPVSNRYTAAVTNAIPVVLSPALPRVCPDGQKPVFVARQINETRVGRQGYRIFFIHLRSLLAWLVRGRPVRQHRDGFAILSGSA